MEDGGVVQQPCILLRELQTELHIHCKNRRVAARVIPVAVLLKRKVCIQGMLAI